MKKITTLTILILLTSDIYPQSGWYQQTLPVSGTILDMQFVNAQTGWITLGNPFNFISTTDGGKNWMILQSGTKPFWEFEFINDTLGYSIGFDGTNGYILETTNSGVNWVQLHSSSENIYKDLTFINKDTGYFCGQDGNLFGGIWITTNGGLNISRIYTTGFGITNLFFLKEKYGNEYYGWWLGGGSMSKTTNSGMNWSAPTSMINGNNGNFISLFFLNKDTGWVGFDISIGGYKIYRTNNGGIDWLEQNHNSQGTPDIYFANENIGWAGYTLFKIFATSNGGNVWGTQISPIVRNLILSFSDKLTGWTGDRFLVHTTDGGGLITLIGIDTTNTRIPESFILKQNYPNPFNPQTTIEFSIKQNSNVSLILFDILGKEILKIYNNENLNTGNYKAVLDFSKDNLSSGTYFYKLIVSDINSKQIFLETKKLTYIK